MAIINAMGASFAMQGNIFGALLIIAYNIFDFFIGRFMFNMGYKLGKNSIAKVLKGGLVKSLIQAGSILGMFMMGALSASFVTVSTALKVDVFGKVISLQEVLDQIAPGILPLALVFGVFYLMKVKKMSMLKILLILIGICLVGALIGFF